MLFALTTKKKVSKDTQGLKEAVSFGLFDV